jgi:nitrogen fixation protein FixH
MTLIDAPRPGFRLNGWHVLAIVTGFFAVVIAVDVGFVVMAVKTFPGEVSVTPYEDGLAYNRSYDALRAQARLGWRATAASEPGAITVEMRDRTGQPLTGLAVTGDLQRPATEAGRLVVAFHETRPGRYVAHPGHLTGAWDLTAHAVSPGGARFTADRRLSWR